MTETTELLVSRAKEKAGDLKISARCLPVLSCCPFYLPLLYKRTILQLFFDPEFLKFPDTLRNFGYSVAGFCAHGKDEETTCLGDSGGPLIWVDPSNRIEYLIGVPSAYEFCGKKLPTGPTIFAAIPGEIAKWIHNKISSFLVC